MSNKPDYIYLFDPKVDSLPPQPEVKRKNIVIKRHCAPFNSINNAYWHIGSFRRFFRWSIYDSINRQEIAYSHTTYGVPHFQFIRKLGGGYFVGPDATLPSERGQGLHPLILWSILSSAKETNKQIFVLVSQENIASIKGIEKAGFRRVGYAIKRLHVYWLCDEHGTLL